MAKSAFTKGLVGYNFAKFLIDNVENQIEVQKVPKEQIAENLIETAKIFKAVATDAKVKSGVALESGDLFLLVSNTITQLTFVLKFAICTSGWMDDFLKILMKVEDVAYFATLKGGSLLTALGEVTEETRTKAYAAKILSFYCHKNSLPEVAPSLNDMKLLLNTWAK